MQSDDPWSRPPKVIAYDYGGTIAPPSSLEPDGIRLDRPLTPQAVAVIRRLHDLHGIRALLSSNNLPSELRRPALRDAGVQDCFDAILLSTELGCGKPDPDFYHQLMTVARRISGGCEPDEIVHVGDNPMTDVTGLIQYGMRAVWITRDTHAALDNRHLVAAARVRVIPAIDELPAALGLPA